jgi:hypothetical protein
VFDFNLGSQRAVVYESIGSEVSAGIARKGGKSVMGRRPRKKGGGIKEIGKERRN